MLDYKLLHALATVVECGGFERAGDVLGLSQSAVSQRIKALEIRLGQPVLVRHPHLAPTPAGQRLLTHYPSMPTASSLGGPRRSPPFISRKAYSWTS